MAARRGRKRLGFARPPPTARPVLQIEKQKPCVDRPGWLLGSKRSSGVWLFLFGKRHRLSPDASSDALRGAGA
jgi:hypothetical protein